MKHYGVRILNLLACLIVHQSFPQAGESLDTYETISERGINDNTSKSLVNTIYLALIVVH